MKPQVKEKWVSALRSGQYGQTTRILKTINGDKASFCCLGVLCNLFIEENPDYAWNDSYGQRDDSKTYSSFVKKSEGGSLADASLPVQVCEWAGIATNNPVIGHGLDAIQANDEVRLSFIDIADIIEDKVSEDLEKKINAYKGKR